MNWDIILLLALVIWQEPIKIDPGSWVGTFTAVATIAAAALGGSYGTYKAVQKIRENARKSKAAEEEAINKRISEAVERKRGEMQTMVDMAQQSALHWKDMVDLLEREKIHDRETHAQEKVKLEAEIDRIREERNDVVRKNEAMKVKIEEIVDLNLGLQGQVNENAQEIRRLQESQGRIEVRQQKSENRQKASDERQDAAEIRENGK